MHFRLLTLAMSLLALRRSLAFRPVPLFGKRTALYGSSSVRLVGTDWPVDRVRNKFVDYFVEQQQHTNYKSSPCVPVNDPTLLFANAGMNQFKSIFTGTADPNTPMASLRRAVNSQKCIRAGGKHNDLDDVGKDTYHHTFFEMLGTWSFGNYFKKEAIEWAYDILVNHYHLDPNRLYASYFGGDEALGLPCDVEARDLWLKFLPAERVLPFDKKANFWEMGDTGPCGPCSEIHYDRIGHRDASALVNADDPDVIEIWNLVFIQFNREPSGELRQLPNKHIDTGMGLERLTSILQGKRSNYDTDVFKALFDATHAVVGGAPYAGKIGAEDAVQNYRDTAYRIIADHVRTLTFAIADGAVPSNEGRGYVLRRILRRAVRYGVQTLGAPPGFFAQLVPVLVQEMAAAYPELTEKQAEVVRVVTEEEAAFTALLQRGVKYFNDLVGEMRIHGETVISGEKAFFMYDTLGFPIDLTQIMANEARLTVDLEGFHAAMKEQQQRSRVAARQKRLGDRQELALGAEETAHLQRRGIATTNEAAKYVWDQVFDTRVVGLFGPQGLYDSHSKSDSPPAAETVGIVLRDTAFYAEAGGQAADTGKITITTRDGRTIVLDVLDVQVYAGYVLHTCVTQDPEQSLAGLEVNCAAHLEVDYARRRKTAPNHTMTHTLNFALRQVLGGDINQKGSSVTHEKLRFDFSCNQNIRKDELENVERVVNDVIREALEVRSEEMPLQQAQQIPGLRAVFGEVYPDPVRVVSMRPKGTGGGPDGVKYSAEFCGGTHIGNTKEAEAFVILEETAIAKGIRRIVGLTGAAAQAAQGTAAYLQTSLLELEARRAVHASLLPVEEKIASLRQQVEGATISAIAKGRFTAQLDVMQKEVFVEKKALLAARVEQELEAVKQVAARLHSNGVSRAVFVVPVGSDSRAIKQATETIKSVAPSLSFLCISSEEDKVTTFAHCTDAAQQAGLLANAWVTQVMAEVGGKGGGRPGSAQGSASVGPGSQLQEAVQKLKLVAEKSASTSTL